MRPTPRSVHARQLIKIFDGECREDNFRRARMIRAFPKNAMMDMGIVKKLKLISSWLFQDLDCNSTLDISCYSCHTQLNSP